MVHRLHRAVPGDGLTSVHDPVHMYLHRLHRAVPGGGLTSVMILVCHDGVPAQTSQSSGGGLTSVMILVCTYDGVPAQTSQSSTWWWSYLCHDPGVYI